MWYQKWKNDSLQTSKALIGLLSLRACYRCHWSYFYLGPRRIFLFCYESLCILESFNLLLSGGLFANPDEHSGCHSVQDEGILEHIFSRSLHITYMHVEQVPYIKKYLRNMYYFSILTWVGLQTLKKEKRMQNTNTILNPLKNKAKLMKWAVVSDKSSFRVCPFE